MSPFSLTVLGNSGSYPGPGAACSGYLLRSGGCNVWLDAGPGTMANLQGHIRLADLDAVVVSHDHPDHWSDLDGLYVACRYVEVRPDVPVYAPASLPSLLRSRPYSGTTIDWRTIRDGSSITVGPFAMTFSRTDHPTETLAVRVEADGRTLGYSADTGPGWSMAALGGPLDTALCEATHLEDRAVNSVHLSARQAGETARAAGASRLLITHIWPIVDPKDSVAEAVEAFGGPVEWARIGETYSI